MDAELPERLSLLDDFPLVKESFSKYVLEWAIAEK